MSLIFATQLTAVFTAILGVGAIVTAVLAGLALRKQSQEVGLLLEQNKRDTDERRKAQASLVFLAAPRDAAHPLIAYAHNGSGQPVYDTSVRYATTASDLSEPEYLGTIMPGESAPSARQFADVGEALRLAVLMFRDAAGINWIRTPDGNLWEDPSPGKVWVDLLSSTLADNARRSPRDFPG